MSGIVGIAHSDDTPVNSAALRRMTLWLSFRGPDAQEVWTDGPAGLGHALLATTPESERERQPTSLDQKTWITADARLDGRRELVDALRSNGRDTELSNSDAQLLLHAHEAWGENCVDHLLGDFAFGIWDGRKREFFCACDHFGIKSFYFAEVERSFIFSNTLDCLRLHPAISDRLNDAAIADFLLFGMNYDAASTSFADIRRLPRAHMLRWSRAGLELREYWRPPADGSIVYRRRGDYVERFRELLTTAVEDRLRTNKVGILLSGGLDSSSVAAVARDLQKANYPSLELHAFTSIYERLLPDGDAPAARTVAAALQIPVHCWAVDSVGLFEGWEDPCARWPEPMEDPFACGFRNQFKAIAGNVRVLLSGEGSDNLMGFEMAQHFRSLWREGRVQRALLDLSEHVWQRFQAPDGLRGPLRRIGRLFARQAPASDFPEWINPELASRLKLQYRWRGSLSDLPYHEHPRHPKAYGSLFLPQWRYLFEHGEAGITRQPVEIRFPFLDLRLVNYLLAIPSMPWFFRKYLLRETMRGRLPEAVRRRPKTPLQGDPVFAALRDLDASAITKMPRAEKLSDYVDEGRFPSLEGETDPDRAALKILPMCLNFWLLALFNIKY